MRPLPIAIGQRFTRLVVIERDESQRPRRMFMCRCDCGALLSVRPENLHNQRNKSCGCLSKDLTRERFTVHGHARDRHAATRFLPPEYVAWCNMLARCGNPKHRVFHHYGGRGIRVCEAWRASFEQFLRDVGLRPSPKHSIDRINNDGHYEPGNIRWATQSEQMRNTRRAHAAKASPSVGLTKASTMRRGTGSEHAISKAPSSKMPILDQ